MAKACRGYESWKKKNDPDYMPWLWPDQITSDLIGELKTATCISIHEIRYIQLPYRTKVFIGVNVREIRDCQNRERFKPTKSMIHQVLVA